MATTEQFYTGNGSTTTFGYTFPILQNSDLKVELDGVIKTENTSGTNNDYSISGTNVVLNSAPANGVDIHIYRLTDVDSAKAVFAAGSSIRAGDLNNNVDQSLYSDQEQQQKIKTSDVRDDAITTAKIKDGTIVNANVSASAAIDGTKISPDFGSQVLTTTGNIVVGGTVDGRDVAADGTKLDAIESSATADQTAAEIRTLVESATDSNVFTDADHTKLNAIEAGATADQTNAEIRTAVEAATDSNVFTDADHTKLNAIEASATADQTGAEIKSAYEGESNTNAFTDAEKTKLGNLGSLNALSDVNTSGVADGKILKYQSSSSSFIIADDGGSGSGGATAFTGLSDTPANYGSAAGKTLKINSAGDAVEFVTVTTPAGNFAGLTDTPANFTGAASKTVKVNSAANALEFVDVATDVVDDTTPQLGGNLDVQASEITTSTTNGNIKLTPNGTGKVEVKGNTNAGSIQLNCENNSHGVTLKGPAHSAGASYTLTLPNNIVNGQFLKTDTNGNLSWAAVDLTALSAANLTSGTIPDARFPATLPAVSGANLTNLPASQYNIQINTLSSSSGSGGGSATFNGSATRFTLSNAGTNAQAHIVSVNGVIQKPNSGTSPSEGFAIDGNDIIFAAAPASGSDFFILTLGNAISIGTPSDNTVTSAKIVDGSIINADINTSAAIAGSKLADDSITETKLDIHAAPSGTDKVLGYTANGMEWVVAEAGATGGGTDKIFYENGQTVTTNYTITNNTNAMSAGPVTINNGIAVTIGTGENWTIV